MLETGGERRERVGREREKDQSSHSAVLHSKIMYNVPNSCADAMGSSALLVMELFPLCADILDTLCMAVLRACPQELNPHLHTVVMTLMPFARQIRTTQGKQVKGLWNVKGLWKTSRGLHRSRAPMKGQHEGKGDNRTKGYKKLVKGRSY